MKRPVGIIAILSLALAISFIAACGGGGGGDTSSGLQGTWELVEVSASTYEDNTCTVAPTLIVTEADENNLGVWVVGETETYMFVEMDGTEFVSEFGLYTLDGSLDDFPLTVTGSYSGSYDGTVEPAFAYFSDNICWEEGASGKIMSYAWERVSDNIEMP